MNFLTQTKCCLFLVLVVFTTILNAQAFQKKDAIGSAGIGLTHLNRSFVRLQTKQKSFAEGFPGVIQTEVKGTNPLTLKYEYAIAKNFSLGFSFAWYSIEINVKDSYTVSNGSGAKHVEDKYSYKLSSGSLGLRLNYHFPLESLRSDLYVGCAIGFTKNSLAINVKSSASAYSGFADVKLPNGSYIATTLGYRYYFTGNFAFNAELGYEKGALMVVGLAYRFRPYHYELPK